VDYPDMPAALVRAAAASASVEGRPRVGCRRRRRRCCCRCTYFLLRVAPHAYIKWAWRLATRDTGRVLPARRHCTCATHAPMGGWGCGWWPGLGVRTAQPAPGGGWFGPSWACCKCKRLQQALCAISENSDACTSAGQPGCCGSSRPPFRWSSCQVTGATTAQPPPSSCPLSAATAAAHFKTKINSFPALAAPAPLPVFSEFRQLPLVAQRARAGSPFTLVFAQLRGA
jgi:hypothetical protein